VCRVPILNDNVTSYMICSSSYILIYIQSIITFINFQIKYLHLRLILCCFNPRPTTNKISVQSVSQLYRKKDIKLKGISVKAEYCVFLTTFMPLFLKLVSNSCLFCSHLCEYSKVPLIRLHP